VSHLDVAVLERLRATVGDDMFAELIQEFVNDSIRLQQRLLTAVARTDLDAARRAAHELRGVAVLFGAKELAALCVAVDKDGDLESAPEAARICGEVRETVAGTTRNRRTGVA
jgi:HPt (histidine-containing phosphotransfer) domain-containing protein